MFYVPELIGGAVVLMAWSAIPDRLLSGNGNGRKKAGFFRRWFQNGHSEGTEEVIKQIPVDRIFQNPYQPRRKFSRDEMEQLKRSIKEYGVLVPIMARTIPRGYELACGERRLRACRDLGMTTIPAIVKQLTTPQMVELALVENLVRSDLIPLEEADTYERLKKEFTVKTEAELAEKFGLSKEKVERYKMLASLPVILKKALITDLITEEHARALAQIRGEQDMLPILSELIEKKLSPDQLQERIDAYLQTAQRD